MFNKFKRNIKVIHVFHKYRIFSIIFNESKRRYDTVDLCTCSIDHQRRDNAIRLRMAFEELGPTFTKLGQAMSKRTDLVPVEYGRELEKLQESVQAYDFEKMQESFNLVCNISSKETGTYSDITSLFDEFNTEPIASASIAQVYEAVLDGKDVVIKIPRPGMEDIIKLDLDILYDVKFFVRKILRIKIYIDIDGFLDEFKYMLIRELDYRNEALNMERFRDNFNNTKDVHIPKVCWELSND
ncbi:MAG: AarF/ABC1/UbiB kinase family protein, partial [Candidatus Methanomarinus sp.]